MQPLWRAEGRERQARSNVIRSPMTELRKVVYTPHIYVINLIIDGESHTAVMKELQFHPVTDALLQVE